MYEQMCRYLTLHDIMLLVHTLECLYSLSSLGERACNCIVRVHGVIDTLVSLITVEAQSYGPKACILMRVVETVSGYESWCPPNSTPGQPVLHTMSAASDVHGGVAAVHHAVHPVQTDMTMTCVQTPHGAVAPSTPTSYGGMTAYTAGAPASMTAVPTSMPATPQGPAGFSAAKKLFTPTPMANKIVRPGVTYTAHGNIVVSTSVAGTETQSMQSMPQLMVHQVNMT